MSSLSHVLFAQDVPEIPEIPDMSAEGGAIGLIGFVIFVGIGVIILAGVWKTFTKAGKPGWGAIIPIYNIILLLQIAGRPVWWIILLIIPVVNFVVAIIMGIDIAKNFGKGTGFGVGLALLGFIFYPIIGFGDARYQPQSQA
jgi:hypothetical protein